MEEEDEGSIFPFCYLLIELLWAAADRRGKSADWRRYVCKFGRTRRGSEKLPMNLLQWSLWLKPVHIFFLKLLQKRQKHLQGTSMCFDMCCCTWLFICLCCKYVQCNEHWALSSAMCSTIVSIPVTWVSDVMGEVVLVLVPTTTVRPTGLEYEPLYYNGWLAWEFYPFY